MNNVKEFLKQKAQEDLRALETEEDRKILQRLKNSISVPMQDYLFQVLTDENVVSQYVYISAPTMKEARKRFSEKMKTDYGAGKYSLICIYRKIC